MSIQDQLVKLAESLRIELTGSGSFETLEPLRARVGPDLPELQLNEILEYDLDLEATLDPLTTVSKNVRFFDQFPETPHDDRKTFTDLSQPANVIGGIPISTPITGGFTSTPGMPGIIAQLSGMVAKLSGKVPILSATKLPVALQVQWFVAGNKEGTQVLEPGKDYLAPEGLDGRSASFLFLPSLSDNPAAAVSRWLFAKVKVSAGAFSLPTAKPEIRLPGIEVKVPTLPLAPLLAERFQVQVPVPTLAPAQAAEPKLVETQVENTFTRLRALLPNLKLTLSYELTRNGAAPEPGDVVDGSGNAFPAAGDWTPGTLLKFFLRPRVEPLRETPLATDWSLALKAKVTGLPGTTGEVPVALPAVRLGQLPVSLPVLVAGFSERWWEGDEAIVFVHHQNPLFQGAVDRRNLGAVEQVKSALLTPLETALKLLQLLSLLFPNLLGTDLPIGAQLGHLRSFVQKIRERIPANLVLTAEEKNDDLGKYDAGWYDRISSLFMIGAPGGPTFKLFEGKAQQSHELHLRMKPGFLAASYWTIHESAFKNLNEPFDSPPTVPDPGREQEGRSASYPNKSFGNIAKSFRWDD